MKLKIIFISSLIFISNNIFAYNQNFTEAKKQLLSYYKNNPRLKTFYCDCGISWIGKKGIPKKDICGYLPRNENSRSSRVEWEHVMPASWFGQQLQCWQNGGRQYCSQHDANFRRMEGDMHNLFPVIGELNNDRSNFRFGVVNISAANYGSCDFKVDFKGRTVEPRDEIKGDVARAMLYMNKEYNLKISKTRLRILHAWSNSDPVSTAEIERNNFIKIIQGNGNPFIEGSYLDRLKDVFFE